MERTTSKKRVCILSFSDVYTDVRILREIACASKTYQVDVIGYGKKRPSNGLRYYLLRRTNPFSLSKYPLLVTGKSAHKFYEQYYWRREEYRAAAEILVEEKYDLIHANDWDTLPVAVYAARRTGSRVLFDEHEYCLGQGGGNAIWEQLVIPYREYLLRTYQDGIAGMITVSEGIKDLYKQRLGWNSEVVMNIPWYVKSKFNPVDPAQIHLVHHGNAMPARSIHEILQLITLLDKRFRLNFILIPIYPDYLNKIKKMAEEIAPDRVVFWDPVPFDALIKMLSLFDLEIPLMRAKHLSYYNALPNKFFEGIMAGLGVAVSPLPMMQKIVKDYQLGIVAEDQSPEAMAQKLNSLSAEEINHFKKKALIAARTFNAENEMEKLNHIYQQLVAV
jgi:glycosyltransferase involved in cell wall biosynthesis